MRRLLAALLALVSLLANPLAAAAAGSVVTTAVAPGNRYSYLVNGQEQLFVGMGYNPIYRYLPPLLRAADYRRDFRLLCQAGVNTITGWDADKGYDQDKFDELTLDTAGQYGIGVVMPIYMPPDGNYQDPQLIGSLFSDTLAKVQRFKNNPALRMWGVGNEVLTVMPPDMYPNFLQVYLNVIDLVHQADPNHPVIYREAEDEFVPMLAQLLHDSGDHRPWWLYGMNVYDKDPEPILRRWPSYGLDRPLFVSEFGSRGVTPGSRAQAYAGMWRSIRSHPDFVLGGAPYVWSANGPEPTDKIWGLTDAAGQPTDGTLPALQQLWQPESKANHSVCGS
jgi:beta-galactosidase/beta-glucuronidase